MRPQDPVQHRVSYSEILVGSVELILESTSLYFQGKPHLSFRVARCEAHIYPLYPSIDWREPAAAGAAVSCVRNFSQNAQTAPG